MHDDDVEKPQLQPQPQSTGAGDNDEEHDGYDSDRDSGHGSSIAGSTASLTASIFEYRELYGRTYHADYGSAESWSPNDEIHKSAMDIL